MIKQLSILLIIITLVSCADNETKLAEKNNTTTNKEEDKLEQLLNVKDNEMLVAVIKTNMGTMELELFAKQAPMTVKNFVGLAMENYYTGVTFHRVIDNFMIQGGDPTGSGAGGESYFGGKFKDEFHPSLLHDKPGILSMANAGPNTNGSQFFITLVPTPWLNGKHSVFGQVINGLDVLKNIGKVQTTKPFDKPVSEVVMESVTIEKRNK
ncbi:MAG: peptidylprolyl isomerase [Melioribacteraceae bacterium]|nr:MAG: peptidylprolyl isomerase [Melioribacteraceae bacterium]